jgi:hypothetical protein
MLTFAADSLVQEHRGYDLFFAQGLYIAADDAAKTFGGKHFSLSSSQWLDAMEEVARRQHGAAVDRALVLLCEAMGIKVQP